MKLAEISPELTPVDPQKSAKLQDAAGKFEALVIAQLLKSARQSDSGGWSGETDQATSAIMDMGEQSLSEMLGAQGDFGLAKMVVGKLGAKE